MNKKIFYKIKNSLFSTQIGFFLVFLIILCVLSFIIPDFFKSNISNGEKKDEKKTDVNIEIKNEDTKKIQVLDKIAYDKKMQELANNPPDSIVYENIKTIEKGKNGKTITKITKVPMNPQPVRTHLWPVKTVYPNDGALLPFHRIVAYYGNLYSRKMGVLGEYEEGEMLRRLKTEVSKWNEADPSTPVIPALHYIAVVAQGNKGFDGKYRTRMPEKEIDKVLKIAEKMNAIVFLDIQVGFSTLKDEIPLLEKYLKMPQVHLGIDAEFSMKSGIQPGKVVGTFDANDINYASNFLAKVVKENNLTPKILVVHRYTQKMITNYKDINILPEVQIVMNMDGWGEKAKKIGTYRQFVYKEPVQFTGFKLFYKNDLFTKGTTMFTPTELLKLNPIPSYIQYQ